MLVTVPSLNKVSIAFFWLKNKIKYFPGTVVQTFNLSTQDTRYRQADLYEFQVILVYTANSRPIKAIQLDFCLKNKWISKYFHGPRKWLRTPYTEPTCLQVLVVPGRDQQSEQKLHWTEWAPTAKFLFILTLPGLPRRHSDSLVPPKSKYCVRDSGVSEGAPYPALWVLLSPGLHLVEHFQLQDKHTKNTKSGARLRGSWLWFQVFGRLSQEDHKFKACLSKLVRLWFWFCFVSWVFPYMYVYVPCMWLAPKKLRGRQWIPCNWS